MPLFDDPVLQALFVMGVAIAIVFVLRRGGRRRGLYCPVCDKPIKQSAMTQIYGTLVHTGRCAQTYSQRRPA
jgi:hypothetical protein